MHSKIFQITTKRLEKNRFLNEFTLEQGQFCVYDYCKWISQTEREIQIDNLVMYALPKGMFRRIAEDEIMYNGGIEQWSKEFADRIKETVTKITAENVIDPCCPAVAELIHLINNPLDTDYNFYLHEDCKEPYAVESLEFMQFVSQLKPGTILYIGGVIDYHF